MKEYEKDNKPLIGVKPYWLWITERRYALNVAITYYIEHGYQVPNEWVEEYNSHTEALDKRKE